MKSVFFLVALCIGSLAALSQENQSGTTIKIPNRAISLEECPPELLSAINMDILKTKAALLIFNESLHPLGRYEFFDGGNRVKYLHIPMKMNRCTLLYIDTGLHLFHTLYQQLKEPVQYEQGKIYMARLFSRAAWPLGGISIIKKNDKGEPEEYAAVLFEYINAAKATELLNNMNKKNVLVND